MDNVRTLSATASFDLLVSTREGAVVLLTVAPHVALRGDLTGADDGGSLSIGFQ